MCIINPLPAGLGGVPSSYSHAFSCSGQHAGVIRVDPDGDPCPPYSITYNQVSSCSIISSSSNSSSDGSSSRNNRLVHGARNYRRVFLAQPSGGTRQQQHTRCLHHHNSRAATICLKPNMYAPCTKPHTFFCMRPLSLSVCVPSVQVANGSRYLTVGDEEGCVSIIDTAAQQLPVSLYTDANNPPRAKWLAHNNTIFDLAWAKVHNKAVCLCLCVYDSVALV